MRYGNGGRDGGDSVVAPSFFVLFLFRALLGIGMGAEWPAGAAFAIAVILSPETKGRVLVAELTVA